MKIQIDPEFRDLIPPLTADEFAGLESNIKADGCRDPLVTWEGIIIDGHNRYEICTANSMQFETVAREFAAREEVIEWIIRNQFGRRNIDAYQRTKLALRLEEMIAARAKANQKGGQGGVLLPQNSAEASHVETREEIAKLAGVSRDTVDKVKQIEKKATPEVKASLAKGEISINKAHKTTKTPKQEDTEPEPEPEPEPLIVDGTPPKRERLPKWIPDDAERLYALAHGHLEKILPEDRSRERMLRELIKYAQNRIETNK
jgi:hypothetical protein